MKWYWIVSAFACACLAVAAVWLGGLNQDEGWYLYAANLVHEGQQVYRDFAFTQGPVMPKVYAAFTWIWAKWGLLGARTFTLGLGLLGIVFAALMARKMVLSASCLVPGEKGEKGEKARAGNAAAVMVAMLLGCNLYHLYYLAIPKTYALASLLVLAGMWCIMMNCELRMTNGGRFAFLWLGGVLLGLAAGVRISLGAILPVVGVAMLVRVRNEEVGIRNGGWIRFLLFCVGGVVGLGLSYGFVLFDAGALKGFMAAQAYHAARGGFDLTWVVGSLSRLVRWYLPVFIVLGLGIGLGNREQGIGNRCGRLSPFVLLASFLAVFVVQMMAPFPYEDYQVPIMGLLTVYAAVNFVPRAWCLVPGAEDALSTKHQALSTKLLLVLGLTFASSFGSPLLEKWMTNGQDRFWSLKKEKCELAQLRDAAKKIEAIDPNGTEIFTQDLYLAIESHRKVPKGLEMGPFSILSDAEWRRLIGSATPKVAAISGYTFAINPPACTERPLEEQLGYFRLLKEHYEVVDRMADFGQNATTLLILKRAARRSAPTEK